VLIQKVPLLPAYLLVLKDGVTVVRHPHGGADELSLSRKALQPKSPSYLVASDQFPSDPPDYWQILSS
jgi:hypothetical protein